MRCFANWKTILASTVNAEIINAELLCNVLTLKVGIDDDVKLLPYKVLARYLYIFCVFWGKLALELAILTWDDSRS